MIYDRRPETEISPQNYRFEEISVDLQPVRGEVLVEGVYWSVDPYMRIQQSAQNTWEAPHQLGAVQGGSVVGRVVGRVVEVGADTADLAIGDWVETYMGWRTLGLCKPAIGAVRLIHRGQYRQDDRQSLTV